MNILLRTLFFYIGYYPWTGLCISWALLGALCGGADRLHEIARFWGRGCLWLGGMRLRVEGSEYLRPDRPVVYMSNHQGKFDIPVLFSGIPGQFRWLAKAELFRIPLFGLTMRTAGYVPVERGDRRKSMQSVGAAAKRVAAGTSLMIFPEGTRSPDGQLLPFKAGGFLLAMQAGVEIVPIAIDGSFAALPKGKLLIRSGEIRMRIFPPVPTAGLRGKDREALIAEVEARIASGLTTEAPNA